MLVAKIITSKGSGLADLLADPDTPPRRWDILAGMIDHLSRDPNWRKSPSVLDQVKGRVAPRGRPRKSKVVRKPVAVDIGGSN